MRERDSRRLGIATCKESLKEEVDGVTTEELLGERAVEHVKAAIALL